MCHNFAGAGGALTRGKYAPNLMGVAATHIYEAMLTGPQSMPVFNDTNITPEDKRDIIAYLRRPAGSSPAPAASPSATSARCSEGLCRLGRRHRGPDRLRGLARGEVGVSRSS